MDSLEEAHQESEEKQVEEAGGEEVKGGGGGVAHHPDGEGPLDADAVGDGACGHLDDDVAEEVGGLQHPPLGVGQAELLGQHGEDGRQDGPAQVDGDPAEPAEQQDGVAVAPPGSQASNVSHPLDRHLVFIATIMPPPRKGLSRPLSNAGARTILGSFTILRLQAVFHGVERLSFRPMCRLHNLL